MTIHPILFRIVLNNACGPGVNNSTFFHKVCSPDNKLCDLPIESSVGARLFGCR